MIDLDHIDRRLLAILQEDSTVAIAELAELFASFGRNAICQLHSATPSGVIRSSFSSSAQTVAEASNVSATNSRRALMTSP